MYHDMFLLAYMKKKDVTNNLNDSSSSSIICLVNVKEKLHCSFLVLNIMICSYLFIRKRKMLLIIILITNNSSSSNISNRLKNRYCV